MIRLMTILILLLAGLPQVGIGMFGSPMDTGCQHAVCQPVVVETSCCFEPTPSVDSAADSVADTVVGMDEYCPMSGGPCRCGITPNDDRNPVPMAPFQRNETQITLGLFAQPFQVCIWTTSDDEHSRPILGLVGNLHALRTHAETQAVLGIWIT